MFQDQTAAVIKQPTKKLAPTSSRTGAFLVRRSAAKLQTAALRKVDPEFIAGQSLH
jgi:hypothetical protein